MHRSWLNDQGTFLGAGSPLPLDAPFTRTTATSLGVPRRSFQTLTRRVIGLPCELPSLEDFHFQFDALVLVGHSLAFRRFRVRVRVSAPCPAL